MSNTSDSRPIRRRRFQFGLRSLLLLVTAIGLGLGWASWKLNEIRQHQRVVEEVRRLGATVSFEHQLNNPNPVAPGPRWLKRILGEDFLAEVTQIQLNDERVNDDTLALIATLPNEGSSLIATSDGITDEGLEHLAKGTGLDALEIHSANVTIAGYENLKKLKKLESLIVRDERIDDSWLPVLADLTQVRYLTLTQTRVTDAGLTHLKRASWLRLIDLRQSKVTKEGVDQLKRELPNCRIDWP